MMRLFILGFQLFVLNPKLFANYLFLSARSRFPRKKSWDVNGLWFDYSTESSLRIEKRKRDGLYEMGVRNIMAMILREGDTFLDIGASNGYLTVFAAALVGRAGLIHSVEPSPSRFKALEKVQAMNGEYRIVAHSIAFGEEEGVFPIDLELSKEKVDVNFKKLDTFLQEQNFFPKLVKIDVDGAEFSILHGGGFYLKEYSPVIICELSPPKYPVGDLLEYMHSLSYEVRNIMNPNHKKSRGSIMREKTINVVFRKTEESTNV